jgi:hypothetical protein
MVLKNTFGLDCNHLCEKIRLGGNKKSPTAAAAMGEPGGTRELQIKGHWKVIKVDKS